MILSEHKLLRRLTSGTGPSCLDGWGRVQASPTQQAAGAAPPQDGGAPLRSWGDHRGAHPRPRPLHFPRSWFPMQRPSKRSRQHARLGTRAPVCIFPTLTRGPVCAMRAATPGAEATSPAPARKHRRCHRLGLPPARSARNRTRTGSRWCPRGAHTPPAALRLLPGRKPPAGP